MKIARQYATSDSKVTRNGSVPSQKMQNAPQRTHLMDFFQKNRGDMVAPISTPFMHKKVI
jgi:hypothetical protein